MKALGRVMLAAPFAAVFGFMAIHDWVAALILVAGIGALVTWAEIAFWLLDE